MNGIQEVREQYKQAARTYIEHINKKDEYPQSVNFFQGRMSGLSLALSCLGVDNDEIREMYNTCEEEVRAEREHDRIHQAATDAANQIEREGTGAGGVGRDRTSSFSGTSGGRPMTGTGHYANVPDLSQIPQAILSLVMHDWFDKRDIIYDTKKVDGSYVRVIGNTTEQIEARTEVLKLQRGARNGGGVRIKTVKEVRQ